VRLSEPREFQLCLSPQRNVCIGAFPDRQKIVIGVPASHLGRFDRSAPLTIQDRRRAADHMDRTDMATEAGTRDICLAYASAATRKFGPKDLANILAKAVSHNLPAGITGMLLYIDGSFFQVLEGDAQVIHKLYDKILVDPRHSQAIKLIEEPIEARAFAQWSMGFARVTRDELAKIPGLNDFFGQGSSFNNLSEGRAKTLLTAFREGKWRRRLHR
jgi:hypothetical protein